MYRFLLLFAALLLLTGCAVPGIDVEQEQASGLAGELLDGHSFGQTFVPYHDGLYRIDLYTATYGRENTQPIIFRIQAAHGSSEELVRLELPASQISNSGPTIVTFPPMSGVAGHTLFFSVEAPGSEQGDAITVYRDENDVYRNGQMFIDGQPSRGDLAFIVHTRETYTLADIWEDFYDRASQDGRFFSCFVVLLVLVLAAFALTLAVTHRPKALGGSMMPADARTESPEPSTESKDGR